MWGSSSVSIEVPGVRPGVSQVPSCRSCKTLSCLELEYYGFSQIYALGRAQHHPDNMRCNFTGLLPTPGVASPRYIRLPVLPVNVARLPISTSITSSTPAGQGGSVTDLAPPEHLVHCVVAKHGPRRGDADRQCR